MSYQTLKNYIQSALPEPWPLLVANCFDDCLKWAMKDLNLSLEATYHHGDCEKVAPKIIEHLTSQLFMGDCPDFFFGVKVEDIDSTDPLKYIPAGLKALLNNTFAIPFSDVVFSAVFYHVDDRQTKFIIAKNTIKKALENIYTRLTTFQSAEHEEWLLSTNIHMLLSFFVFMDPKQNEKIFIPVKINEQWSIKEFTIDLIPLDKRFVNKEENDDPTLVYAYGFTPLDRDILVHPYLVFRGTPPFDFYQGYSTAKDTDHKKGYSVGETLLLDGHDNLNGWLFQTNVNYGSRVRLAGHSLGGSCCLLTALRYSALVKDVHAFNPAGILDTTLAKDIFSASWDMTDPKPSVFAYNNIGDLVNSQGNWHNEWVLYKINLATKIPITALKQAHVVNFLGSTGVGVMVTNTKEDNDLFSRWLLTAGKKLSDPFVGRFFAWRSQASNGSSSSSNASQNSSSPSSKF